jgi:hypothetical protein
LQYLCQLGDQELRQQTTRAMADFLWNSIKVLTLFYSAVDLHHLDADPKTDPACHFDAYPDADPIFHINADPDHIFHFDADPDPVPSL